MPYSCAFSSGPIPPSPRSKSGRSLPPRRGPGASTGNLSRSGASLARFGQAEPLVVRRSTGRVIGGNGRLVAIKALGWTECDIVEFDLDDTQATALGIALNRTAELAEWDTSGLAKLLESLKIDGELDGVGFDEAEMQQVLDDLLAEQGIQTSEDEVPAPGDAAITRTGDVWIIGRHRLMCGDSSLGDDVAKLLKGGPIHLVNMDPPYNVMLVHTRNRGSQIGTRI